MQPHLPVPYQAICLSTFGGYLAEWGESGIVKPLASFKAACPHVEGL